MGEFDPDQALFGIYIHWPYCLKVCPYCDFNVYASKSRDTSDLLAALETDLRHQRTLTGPREVTSIYFGGGTPSLMTPNDIERLLSVISDLYHVSETVEITLEANPENVTPASVKDWKKAGINRLSLGVQSFDDDALTFFGRAHTSAQAMQAVDTSLTLIENVSVDLIYARPGQAMSDWLEELRTALSFNAPHLSLYELTIKPNTAFANQVKRRSFTPMDDDQQADLYLETLNLTSSLGLPAYEVSNHAKSSAYQSKHNLTYWMSGEWLGIGPGAEGRITLEAGRTVTRGQTKPKDYITALTAQSNGFETFEPLSPAERIDEALIMGLRSIYGLSQAFTEQHLTGEAVSKIADFIASGHMTQSNGRLSLTPDGWLLADYITRELAPN